MKRKKTQPTKMQMELATRVVDHIRRQALPIDSLLTEVALAREFKVSRTPVHGALQFLSKHGVVKPVAKTGYLLKKTGSDLDRIFLKIPETEEGRLYLRIASDRAANRLPEQFSEMELMRHYGVTRGFLNRVLRRMAAQGLVESGVGMKWSFLPMLNTLEDHEESYRFRLLIEPPSVLEVTFKLDQERAMRCRQAHESILTNSRISSVEWFEINAEFHEMIAAGSGNRFILQAIQQHNQLRRILEYHWLYSRERAQAIGDEHMAILDALEQHDQLGASYLLRQHLEKARKVLPRFDGNGRSE